MFLRDTEHIYAEMGQKGISQREREKKRPSYHAELGKKTDKLNPHARLVLKGGGIRVGVGRK